MDTFEQEVERVVEAAANRDALFATLEDEHAAYVTAIDEEIAALAAQIEALRGKRRWADRVKVKRANVLRGQFAEGTGGVQNYDDEPF